MIMPAPEGFIFKCELLLLGIAEKYFFKYGIEYLIRINVIEKEIKNIDIGFFNPFYFTLN